jgi:hypothetical protein
MTRRRLAQRYGTDRDRRSRWFDIAGSALMGFVAGLLLGVWTGHFIYSLVPAVIGAVLFAGLTLLLAAIAHKPQV